MPTFVHNALLKIATHCKTCNIMRGMMIGFVVGCIVMAFIAWLIFGGK